MKNTLEGINSIITEAKERVSDLEDRRVEFTATEQNKEKRMKRNEDSLRDLWDNVEYTHIHIIGVQEGEEIEKGPKKVFEEIIVKNVPKVSQDRGLANLGCPNHPEKLAGKRQLLTLFISAILSLGPQIPEVTVATPTPLLPSEAGSLGRLGQECPLVADESIGAQTPTARERGKLRLHRLSTRRGQTRWYCEVHPVSRWLIFR